MFPQHPSMHYTHAHPHMQQQPHGQQMHGQMGGHAAHPHSMQHAHAMGHPSMMTTHPHSMALHAGGHPPFMSSMQSTFLPMVMPGVGMGMSVSMPPASSNIASISLLSSTSATSSSTIVGASNSSNTNSNTSQTMQVSSVPLSTILSAPLSSERTAAAVKYFETSVRVHDFITHRKPIRAVGWNCSGTKLVCGGIDNMVRVYNVDPRSGASNSIDLKGHVDSIEQAKFSPVSSDMLATAGYDTAVKLWDTRTNIKKNCIATINTRGDNLNMAWAADGRSVAVADRHNCIHVIETRKVSISHSKTFQSLEINQLTFGNRSDCLFMATNRGTIDVVKLPNFNTISSLQSHTATVYSVEMSPNGTLLASGGADATVLIREMTECTPISVMPRMESIIRSLSFSHDSYLLASGGEDPTIEISEAQSSAHLYSIHVDEEIGSLAFNPKDHVLAYSVENKNRPSVYLLSKLGG